MTKVPDQRHVQELCEKLLTDIGRPGFIVIGWKKDDGLLSIVQSVKKMKPTEYFKSIVWALNEVTKKL